MVLVRQPAAKACAPSKHAAWAIVYGPGLDSLSSQAEKLFRSGLIVVGPDWLNETLRRGLVLRPRVDLVLVEFPAVHGIAEHDHDEYLHMHCSPPETLTDLSLTLLANHSSWADE